jgi:hypothetical protein
MIRTYCDICEQEITETNKPESPNFMRAESCLLRAIGSVELSVNIRFGDYRGDNEWRGDYCKYCVLDAILKLDDRKAKATNLPSWDQFVAQHGPVFFIYNENGAVAISKPGYPAIGRDQYELIIDLLSSVGTAT